MMDDKQKTGFLRDGGGFTCHFVADAACFLWKKGLLKQGPAQAFGADTPYFSAPRD
jgi:hypothetical protein